MGKLTELEQWEDDIYQIETSDPVLGGPDGVTNKPAKQLANRTLWLKQQLLDVNNALAEHARSRNHPDASLVNKGFVKLYSGVTSMDETMAATPKAVKIAMDNANARLAKERNLADLQNLPLALSNLTLANVKKAVEETHLGLSKLPTFLPETEADLDALPVGFIGECKNKTPGGPLPTEQWCYIHKTGNLDNYQNEPNRKGGTIRLACIWKAGEVWTGAKFDDGSSPGVKYEWARDFNSLNKPTPEDVGLAATKKAIDDTQIGLDAQGVMWISTANDLSNLPAGARRFARNNAGVTVLPSAGYFFLEVLAKRDVANGSCILATSDTRDVWIGLRYTVPDEAGFTWIQLNQSVQTLGLTDAVNRALNAVQKTGDQMTGNIGLRNDGRMHFYIADADGNVRMWLYKDKGGDGVRLNNGYDGGGEFVFHKNGEFYSPSNLHAGNSVVATDGNILGALWGGWLRDWLNSQFTARDNNIGTRATWGWVNQNFVSNIILGAEGAYYPPGNTVSWTFKAPGGCMLTGIIVQDTGSNSADNMGGVFYKPIQKLINGVPMTIAG
ncbi:tail fiber protein [Salmonella enterica]|nr:tail fiber protein [Salmonella enterica]